MSERPSCLLWPGTACARSPRGPDPAGQRRASLQGPPPTLSRPLRGHLRLLEALGVSCLLPSHGSRAGTASRPVSPSPRWAGVAVPVPSLMGPLAERSPGQGCPCCRPPGSEGLLLQRTGGSGRTRALGGCCPAVAVECVGSTGAAGPARGGWRQGRGRQAGACPGSHRGGLPAGHWVGGEGASGLRAAPLPQHPGHGFLEMQGRAGAQPAWQPR